MKLEQPTWPRHLPAETVTNLATLGPLGMRMKAPGTWGSAAGLLFFVVCFTPLSIPENLFASAVLAYVAVGICGRAEIIMGRKDPGEVILDEFVAMPLCFLGWRMIAAPGFLPFVGLLLAGFALFRFYDIRKPWVIDRLQALPGGWGIVIDDTAAALATCGTLHLAHALWGLFSSAHAAAV
jgi:phosphatidylglycerophosphatase A